MRDLFPLIESGTTAAELPIYRDIAWDLDADCPVYSPDGDPVIAEGLEALKGWMINAVRTERYRWEIYDAQQYGCELTQLSGQQYTADTKLSEAARYAREALLDNPYISGVQVSAASFFAGQLTMDLTVITIYGEVLLHV